MPRSQPLKRGRRSDQVRMSRTHIAAAMLKKDELRYVVVPLEKWHVPGRLPSLRTCSLSLRSLSELRAGGRAGGRASEREIQKS